MKSIFPFALLLLPALAAAEQHFQLKPGSTVTVEVSAKEPNRVAIDGGRVHQFFGGEGRFAVETDAANGQIFVRLIGASREIDLPGGASIKQTHKDPASLFVVDEKGRTYTLVLNPADKPAENILITPVLPDESLKVKPQPRQEWRTMAWTERVSDVVMAMARNNHDAGYDARVLNQPMDLLPGVDETLVARYESDDVIGEELRIHNPSEEEVRLLEALFQGAPGTVAIAIEDHILRPGAGTRVFIVKEPRHD